MLSERINPFELHIPNIGDQLDSVISTTSLLEELKTGSTLNSRQELCVFLGIRESTLSGWLKDDRLPRTAKVAFGLLLAFDQLMETWDNFSSAIKHPIPIKMGNTWGLAKLESTDDGSFQSVLIAEGITDYEQAKLLAAGALATEKLKRVVLSYLNDLEGLTGENPLDDSSTLPYSTKKALKDAILTSLKDDEDISEWRRDQ